MTDVSTNEVLSHMRRLAQAQRDNADLLYSMVRAAKHNGITWKTIGEAMGMSPGTLRHQFYTTGAQRIVVIYGTRKISRRRLAR